MNDRRVDDRTRCDSYTFAFQVQVGIPMKVIGVPG